MNVDRWVTESGRAKYKIAADAGIARTTLDRAILDPDPVRLGTLKEIAFACGVELANCGEPLGSLEAALAARWHLEPGFTADNPETLTVWLQRLQRWAGEGTRQGIVESAARALNLRHLIERSDTISLTAVRNHLSSERSEASPWAWSGDAGLLEDGPNQEIRAPQMVLWVGDTGRWDAPSQGAASNLGADEDILVVNIVEAPQEFFQNRRRINEQWVVSPLQLLLDCLSLGGAIGDRARQKIKWWRADH